jgi:hypothetical protein
MAINNPALPYGLRDVKLTPVNADGSLGASLDLPVARVFTFNETEAYTDLQGDDQTVASHGAGPTVDWELEAGGISLAALQIIAGGTLTSTGTTPNGQLKLSKKTTDARPYFQVEGQAISDSGGDMHAVVYRCKATGDIEGQFQNGQFMLSKCKGKGYGNNVGTSPNFNLWDWIVNESVNAIPAIASIAITPLTAAYARPSGAVKLTATATLVGGGTLDVSNLVQWLSSAPLIAVANAGGFVNAGVNAGSANITCNLNGVTSTAPSVQTVS